MSREDLRNVLGFWHYQMHFSAKEVLLSPEHIVNPSVLPWEEQQLEEDRLLFAVKGSAKGLWPEHYLPLPQGEMFRDIEVYLYNLALDGAGRYRVGTFTLNPYVWAMAKLSHEESSDEAVSFQAIRSVEEQIDEELTTSNPVFTRGIIHSLNKSIYTLFYAHTGHMDLEDFVLDSLHYEKRDRYWARQEAYLRDFRTIASRVDTSEPLAHYILRRGLYEDAQIWNLEDPTLWKNRMNPSCYSPVAWPRKGYANLAQQWILNDIFQSDARRSILAYQAPEGSGRRVLVEDRIAQNMYTRALVLRDLSKVPDAFTMRRFQEAPDNYSANYYAPISSIGSEVLTVVHAQQERLQAYHRELLESTNLAAQESHAQAFRRGRDRDVYFGALAKDLYGLNAQSLSAVYIENAADLLSLVEKVQAYLDKKSSYWAGLESQGQGPLSFIEAKKRFSVIESKVSKKLEEMKEAYQACEEMSVLKLRIDGLLEEQDYLKDAILELDSKGDKLDLEIQGLEESLRWREEDLEDYKLQMKGLNKLLYTFFRIGPYKNGIESLEEKVRITAAALGVQRKAKQEHAVLLHDKNVQEELLAKQIFLQEEKVRELEPKHKKQKDLLGSHYADYAFYQNLHTEEVQDALPWMDEELAALREELYAAALDLNKSFILESTEIKANMNRLELILRGKFTNPEDREDSISVLLNTLRLIVPALYIPLHFLLELEVHCGKEALGNVLYLNAEKHHPYKLLSVFWRSRQSIVLSDHLSMRTTKHFLSPVDYYLQEQFSLDSRYLDIRMAASDFLLPLNQTLISLGDTVVPFSLRFLYEKSEPIYSLDNVLCWGNQLIGHPMPLENKKGDFLTQTDWLEIGGDAVEGTMFVPNEAKALSEMLLRYVQEYKRLPTVKIYMFFPSVWDGFNTYIDEHWLSENSDFLNSISVQAIDRWRQEHVLLLKEWNGLVSDEVVFLCGGDQSEKTLVEKRFWHDPKALHTMFSVASRKFLMIADADLWGDSHAMQRVFVRLSKDISSQGLNKKYIYFYPTSESLEDKEYIETDQYYSSPEDRAIIRMKKMFPDLVEINTSNVLLVKSNADNFLETTRKGMGDLLEELERLSMKTCTIVTNQEWICTYLGHGHDESAANTTIQCSAASRVEYHRVGKAWIVGKIENI